LDEVAPDNPDILPADDDCPVGAPCKLLWWIEIPDGQPSAGISGMVLPAPIVGLEAAVVPDGAIIGKLFASQRVGPVGRCATEGTIISGETTWLDGTMDASTTTGSPSDLCSFSNWPTQLNGVRDDFLAANPGAVLSSRWVGCSATQLVNVLLFTQTDGSVPYIVVGGDPTAPPSPPTTESCGPWSIKTVLLGLSADNPNTAEDEGGLPLRTCVAACTYSVSVSLDRDDTPPGDPVVLEDTAVCSPNTPAGSGVSVPLNGGTEALAGIDVTFSEVSGGGSTTVITTTTGPPAPTGFKIVGLAELPLYFDINTDASYSGDLTVCIRYDESQVAGPEANLKLMQRVDGFVDITTSVDTANNVVCGTTSHLSIFIVAEPPRVTIDIKPGSDPNSINLCSKGVIAVAILTTEDFDASTVDPLSVEFGPDGATETHGRGHPEDVDGDGDEDLVLHFRTQETGIGRDDTEACLTGQTFDGLPIQGCDSVRIVPDTDCDGCTDGHELAMGFDPLAWHDFYDVPVPANPDPTPSGIKNQAITMGEVLAVLFYVGTYDGGSPNANGVEYDSDKGADTDGDTVADIAPDGVPDGQGYDRSASAQPNPPWDAGPPDGAVTMGDVLVVLAQVGLDCSGEP